MKTIFVDLDNTIAEFSDHLVNKVNELYGSNIAVCQIDFNYSGVTNAAHLLGKTREELYKVVYSPGFFRDLKPIPGAIETLEELVKTGYKIRIMTSIHRERPPINAPRDKFLWVEKYLSNVTQPSEIIFAEEKALLIGENSILIDDAPGYLQNPLLKGRVIGFRRMYNQTINDIPFFSKWSKKRVLGCLSLLEK